jgi:hypothetical protein
VGAARASEVSFLVEPRLITEADIPWLYYLCKKKYAHKFDAIGTENWLRNTVFKQAMIFHPARMPNAFCISLLSLTPWLPSEIECNIVFICADDGAHWEAMHLLRDSIEWSRMRNVKSWKVSSDTEIDLRMMALRLGATEQMPRWCLRL